MLKRNKEKKKEVPQLTIVGHRHCSSTKKLKITHLN